MSEKLDLLAKCRGDLEFFARTCLKVRNKSGDFEPLILNPAQRVLHEKLEQQRKEKGWVRALVLKGRQQGISTYTAARFYHRASLYKGRNVYILSHEITSSDTLFGIVDRYQRNNPLAPNIGTSNIKELVFDKLDSSYSVATAGQKAGGRGKAISLFHGSEVAFWNNAPDHFASSVQGVPLARDTEVILESTSNGIGGEFYERCEDSISGRGDYQLIFLQWWLSPEYSRDPEPGFQLSKDADDGEMSEQEYADTYKIGLRQMAWRRGKIQELRNPALFQREYPATPSEAWIDSSSNEPFISPRLVSMARKRQRDPAGPLILGVDPAGGGGDRFAVAARRGLAVEWVTFRNRIDTLEGTAWIRTLIDEHKPARVNIDAGNIGAAIITNLKSIGPKYLDVVRAVNFGGTAQAKLARPKAPGPVKRRDEMWLRVKEWLELEEGASLPDDEAIQKDLCSPRLKPNLNNDTKLEGKAEMKTRGVRSPDLGDAVALTFASNEYFKQYQDATLRPVFADVDTPREFRYYEGDVDASSTSWMI